MQLQTTHNFDRAQIMHKSCTNNEYYAYLMHTSCQGLGHMTMQLPLNQTELCIKYKNYARAFCGIGKKGVIRVVIH